MHCPLLFYSFIFRQNTEHIETCVCMHILHRCDGYESYKFVDFKEAGSSQLERLGGYTAVLPIYVFKSYSVIYSNFSTEEAGFDWQLWVQKLFFVHKTGTALQEMRGGFGPHAHSFPGLSRDLIATVINSNAFMTLCHL